MDEEEEEWEEEYIFVELVGLVDPDALNQCNTKNTAVLGLGTSETNVFKLGNNIFSGKLEESVGTKVFFEETEDRQLKYLCHTTKTINATRAFLKPKQSESGNDNENEVVETMQTDDT